MVSSTFWIIIAAVFFELHFRFLHCITSIIQHTIERYTAPDIKIESPQTDFTDKVSAVHPLNPRSAGEGLIQCYDKGTNTPIGIVKALNKDDIKVIVERARVAQAEWAKTPFSVRRKLFFSLMDWVLQNQKLLCQIATIECGKTIMDGVLGEILTTLEKLRWTTERGEDILAEEVRDVGLMTIHKRASVVYMPFGVIGAIVSWNYPFHNIWGPMISAVFAGNAFIGKTSEYSSYYTAFYQDIIRVGLKRLGQNPDLVNFVVGFADVGEAIVENCDKVTFIGSPGVGKLIMKRAAENLTPVVLELGGKDPAILCDDTDLEQVIPIIMRGTFQNCGQNCVGVERVFIQESIHDEVVRRLVKLVKPLTQGAPSQGIHDLGAMTMGKLAVEKIQRLVNEAVAAGAKLLVGGKATTPYFFPATILDNVDERNPIALDEVFGPVLVIMKFKNDEELIHKVNACPYSLGSNVFTADIARGRRIASRVHAGMCNINDFAINYLCQSLPFGGVGISGFDRFAGVEGLRGNCMIRAQTQDRLPWVKTRIPGVLQYPITDAAFTFMDHLSKVIYGRLSQCVWSIIALAAFKAHVSGTTSVETKTTKKVK